jgi:hypothetical protein
MSPFYPSLDAFEANLVTLFGETHMSRFLRDHGIQDSTNVNAYKRFKNHPKTECSRVLFKGDSRGPDEIEQSGGFFPQTGVGRSNVTAGGENAGASNAMVCLTLEPGVAAYYALTTYGGHNWKAKKGNRYPYVYAVYLPMGRGICNYKLAQQTHSKNALTWEVSTLAVPFRHVIGWRKLPEFDSVGGIRPVTVRFEAPYKANPECRVLPQPSPEERKRWTTLAGFDHIYVPDTV